MYKPYKAERRGCFPIVTYEDTLLFIFGFFGMSKAKNTANDLNSAFNFGFMKAITLVKNKEDFEKLIKILKN